MWLYLVTESGKVKSTIEGLDNFKISFLSLIFSQANVGIQALAIE